MDTRLSPFKNKARMSARFRISYLITLFALLFGGCASVSVTGTEKTGAPRTPGLPDKILVEPFAFDTANLRVDREGEELAAFRLRLAHGMADELAQRLGRQLGVPVEVVVPGAPLPPGRVWLVRGRFERVHQGSRFLRAVIGLGAGGTKMETAVSVSDAELDPPTEFLIVRTSGGSNISPGIGGVVTYPIQGPMAVTSVFNVIDGLRSGVTFDAMRTARELNAAISEHLWKQGAIPREKAVAPKRPGSIFRQLGPEERGRIRVTPADEAQPQA